MSEHQFKIQGFQVFGTSDVEREEIILEEDVISKDKCFGCKNNQGAQAAHMDCDTGCLHNKKSCEFCT